MKLHPRLVALGCAIVFMSGALAGGTTSARLKVTRTQPGNYICLVSGLGTAPAMEKQFVAAAGKNAEAGKHFRPPYDDAFDPRLTCASLVANSKFELVKQVGNERKPEQLHSTSAVLSLTPPN